MKIFYYNKPYIYYNKHNLIIMSCVDANSRGSVKHKSRPKSTESSSSLSLSKWCNATLPEIMECINKDFLIYDLIPDKFKNNEELLLIILKILDSDVFGDMYAETLSKTSLINNRNFIKRAVMINPYILKYAIKFNNDEEIAFISLTYRPLSYKFMSINIRSDIKFAEIAFIKDGNSLQYAPEVIRCNKNLIIIALEQLYLEYVNSYKRSCTNFKIVELLEHKFLLGVKQIPSLLKLDHIFMLELLVKFPIIIKTEIEHLKSDADFMLKVVEQYSSSVKHSDDKHPFLYASYELKRDENFISKVLKINGNILFLLDSDLQTYPKYLIIALCYEINLESIIKKHVISKEIWLKVFESCNNIYDKFKKIIDFIPELKTNREVLLIALRRDDSGRIYEKLDEIDKRNPEYLMMILSNHGNLYIKLGQKIHTFKEQGYITDQDVKELKIASLKSCVMVTPYLKSRRIIGDIDITSELKFGLIAVRQDGRIIRYLKKVVKKNMRIMIAAQAQCVSKSQCCLEYFPTIYNKGLFLEKLKIILGSDSFKRMVDSIHNFRLFSHAFYYFLHTSSYCSTGSGNILNKLNLHGKYHALNIKKKIYEYCAKPIDSEEIKYIEELQILAESFEDKL